MSPVRNFAIAVAILAFAAVSASAQPIISAKSGMIAGIEGKVLLDNQEVEQSATHFPEVKENSVLRTEDGRVEVMLPPGFMLRMGENGSLKMLANRLVDTRVEMLAGSAVVEVDQVSQDFNVTVALKDGVVTLAKVGVYRLDCDPPRIKVFRGSATVQIGGGTVIVGTAKMLSLTGESAAAEKFDVEQTDALDNWSRRRAEAMALANVSGAQYSGSNRPAQGGGGGSWRYNPYFDMYTYIPMSGRMCNPYYGICYYSPYAAYQTFVARPVYSPPAGFGGGANNPGYTQMSGTSSGAATSISTAPSMSSSPAAAAASSSTAAAASSASSGHGSAGAAGHK